MGKRKAESLSQAPTANGGSKKAKLELRANFLSDSESDNDDGGAKLEEPGFKINEDFAKRFEHNKKREELQRREW